MTRTYRCLAMASVLVLSAGCGKKNTNDQTQNPDDVAAEGGEGAGEGDSAEASSRARGSTATRGAGRGTKARKVTAKKPPRVDPIPVDPDAGGEGGEEAAPSPHGLVASAYSHEAKKGFPEDLDSLSEPSETFEVPNLDFDEIDFTEGFPGSAALKENYLIRFNGSLNVVEEGEYELCLHSDDGSQLLLEGMVVVDNSGVHEAAVEACELLYLAPGEYMLEIDYMQGVGPLLTMHFAWAVNGGEKSIVPSEVLYKPVADPTVDG